MCSPGESCVVFHCTMNGGVESGAPIGAPSAKNCTLGVPVWDAATAPTLTMADTVSPASGSDIVTVGGPLALLFTVKKITGEVPSRPDDLSACAASQCSPFC